MAQKTNNQAKKAGRKKPSTVSLKKKLAAEIRGLADVKKAKPDLTKAKNHVARIKKKKTFGSRLSKSSVDGIEIVRLKKPGDSITGIIGRPSEEMYQGSTYPIVLDGGEVVRIVGNKSLSTQIRYVDGLFQRCRITYEGPDFMKGGQNWKNGRYRKIYSVVPVKYEDGE